MKIIILPSWYSNAKAKDHRAGVFHYEQALELSKYCEVAIYYMFDTSLTEESSVRNEGGIVTYRSRYNSDAHIVNWKRIIRFFSQINKEFKPDIIYAHVASEVGRYAVVLGKLFHKPIVITEHSAIQYSGMDKGLGKILGKWIYSSSRCNICVSEHEARELKKIFPRCKFITIYNGVSTPHVNRVITNYRKEGRINIGFVALLYSKDIKGLQYVLPALKKLTDNGYKLMLHIVGDGTYLNYFRDLASRYEVTDECIFYGYCEREKVYEILNAMDFVMSSSLVETFGCTLAEAMMLGKPVLSTRSGGPDEYVVEQVGVLIEKGSCEEIERGIVKMISRKSEFDSEKIRKYAQQKFSMSSICAKYLTVFKMAMEK